MSGREIVITDDNYTDFINPVVAGEQRMTGLIPRDFNAQPHGSLMYAKPFDLPLIPREQWAERFADQKAAKATLVDVRGRAMNGQEMPALDQNGKGYCHTSDTEVLTDRGWVEWPEYNWSDPIGTVNPATHALEFQRPFERHVYEYDGEMVHSTNSRIDFAVTPDHQMYVRKWDERKRTLSDRYSFVRAADIGWYSGLLHAPAGQIGTDLVEVEVPGDRGYDGDDFIALLGLITSDGYAGGTDLTRNWVSFASFREASRPAVTALAARVGFRESPSKPGVFIRYDAGALAAWLRENCYEGGRTGAVAKRVPALVKWASVRQIKLFLSWFDDRNRAGSQFYSASKGLIDDLQELHLRIGKRSTIGVSRAKETEFNGKTIRSKEAYVLTVGEADRLCLERKKHIETDHYKGLVYCAAVLNHTLLTRRNGSVLISSNCWAHSSTNAVRYVRATNMQPYADLSAYSVACIIKGFRDQGGWAGESLEFIAERGVATSKTWPQRSMDRAIDNPNTWAEAARYKVQEWMDLDPELMEDQYVTCLLLGIPVASDYNWWGHSVCSISVDSFVGTGSNTHLGSSIIDNSWGSDWGTRGMGTLKGRRAIPNSAIAPRVVFASSQTTCFQVRRSTIPWTHERLTPNSADSSRSSTPPRSHRSRIARTSSSVNLACEWFSPPW